MLTPRTRKPQGKVETWPRKVSFGRVKVSVYRRRTPAGGIGYLVANYAQGARRLDSYSSEALALEAAARLARQLSEGDSIAGSLTQAQAIEYASALQALAPVRVDLVEGATTLARAVKLVGGLVNVEKAAQEYATRYPTDLPEKTVAEAVKECLAQKAKDGAKPRYMDDLKSRLGIFAAAFQCNVASVTGERIQEWLYKMKIGAQSRVNHRRVLSVFFGFCLSSGYLPKGWNELERVGRIKVRNTAAVTIYTPDELARLLAAASPEFLPCLVFGAFCGLRSSEIERLEWKDVDFAARLVTVTAVSSKTASRRHAPLLETAQAWLAPYHGRTGRVWTGTSFMFYRCQQRTAAATEIKADADKGIKAVKPLKWKANALRHSWISYRLADTRNAPQVADEAGNSVQMIHRHYRELVKPAQAKAWFAVLPAVAENVLNIPQEATA